MAEKKRLIKLASEERGWDNYGTARSLETDANYLSLHLAHKKYAALPEVINLTSRVS